MPDPGHEKVNVLFLSLGLLIGETGIIENFNSWFRKHD